MLLCTYATNCKVTMTKFGQFWTLVIFLKASVEAGRSIISDDGSRFYVEIEENFNWYEAINACTQLKMSLISMDSQKKTQEVNNLITSNFGQNTLNLHLWTGGHDHNVSRHFEWISTDKAFGYTNWASSSPRDTAYHCVFMFIYDALKWYDYKCSYKAGFVCEENHLQIVRNAELILLKDSLDNQTSLLKENTEELDSLKKELETFKKTIQTNVKFEYDELKNFCKQELEDMKQTQEEIIGLQKSSEQQMPQLNRTLEELNALKAQISSYAEMKQMFRDMQNELDFLKSNSKIQMNQPQTKNQIVDRFPKISNSNQSEAIESTGQQDISNPIYCSTQSVLLMANRKELESLKHTNEMLMKELFGVLQKSYELNSNRTTQNKTYIFPLFNRNQN